MYTSDKEEAFNYDSFEKETYHLIARIKWSLMDIQNDPTKIEEYLTEINERIKSYFKNKNK